MSLQRVDSKDFPVVFTPEIRQEDSCSFPYLVFCFGSCVTIKDGRVKDVGRASQYWLLIGVCLTPMEKKNLIQCYNVQFF